MPEVEALDISPKQDGGVLKQIIKEGVGNETPPPGSKVKVHYTGTFKDGTVFDSSRDRKCFQFIVGKGTVIKAWDIAVATMKKGEEAILTCAPHYAYGKAGNPPGIPPDSTLIFNIELLDWTGEDLSPMKDGGIERIQITPGEGFLFPQEGAFVEVHIIGRSGGKIIEDRDVSFHIGEGSEENIIEGIEIAITKFKKGETSKLILKPRYAFGTEGSLKLGVEPNAVVEYTVTLKNYEKTKQFWTMDHDEKIKEAKYFKDKGTSYFKNHKYKLAIRMYKRTVEYVEMTKVKGKTIDEESDSLLLSAHLNLALCYLNTEEFLEAKNSALEAIKLSPDNEKALFRHGKALLALGEPKLASGAFQKCLKIDPNNSAAKVQNNLCMKAIQEQLQKEKKIYANMFEKFAEMDTQREEIEMNKHPNVMSSVGEWGAEDRDREPSEFERENPDILLLNKTGEFKDM